MKKVTFLLLAFLATLPLFSQGPVITMISDGDCSGGSPKVVEMYANGTVDFSLYSIEIQTNANTSWGNTLNLGTLGVVTDDFVYIYADNPAFATEYPSAVNTFPTTSSVVNFNGDDRVRIILDSNGSTVDQYGVDSMDGSGEVWEYMDGYAKRNDGTLPNGTFTAADWSYFKGALDGLGVCNGGSTPFETIIGTASYVPTGGSPSLAITSPADSFTFNPNTASVNVSFNVSNFAISTSSTANDGDGFVQYSVNGGSYTVQFDTSDIVLSGLTIGSYTVEVRLVDNSGNPLTPAVSDTVTFNIPALVQVADITALRADVATNGLGGYYEITGESIFTHGDNFNNRKWFQDSNLSGIMIFDEDEIIPNGVYAEGDHVTNLYGYTDEFNGVLQFVPVQDSGVVVSNSGSVSPQIITLSEYNTNREDYESELIAFENISIVEADGTATFQTGTNYTITDGTDNVVMRTEFFGADYINQIIPQGTLDGLVGLAAEFNATPQIFVRDSGDIDVVLSAMDNHIETFSVYPNPAQDWINISTTSPQPVQIEIYNLLGKRIAMESTTGRMDISNLNTGVYLLKMSQNGKTQTKKLVVE